MSRRAAITGATGYVGSALARRLVDEGDEVVALVRGTSDAETVGLLRRWGVRVVEGDVTAADTLPSLLAGVDDVYHCAAVIGYRRRLRGEMQRVNVTGTQNVVRACRRVGVRRLIHMSSIAAVGIDIEPRRMDETEPFNASALGVAYFDTKYAAERYVLEHVDADFDAVAVNPGAIFGPSEAPSNSRHVVLAALGGKLRVVPQGGINAVPLTTVVEGTVAAARRGVAGERYILGGENLTNLHLIRRIGQAGGLHLDPWMLPNRLGGVVRAAMDAIEPFVPDGVWFTPDLCACFGRFMWFDNAKAKRELGVQSDSPHDLDAALSGAVEQLKRQGALR